MVFWRCNQAFLVFLFVQRQSLSHYKVFFFLQPKRRRSRRNRQSSSSDSSSEDERPQAVINRKRPRGGEAEWGTDDALSDRSRGVQPVVHAPGNQHLQQDRFGAIEASLSVLVEQNDSLLEQNQSLQRQVSALEEKVACRSHEGIGAVITKVIPVSARVPVKTAEKIRDRKYVDFRDMFERDTEDQLQSISKDSEGNEILVRRKAAIKRKSLSFTEWGIAWSRFSAILSEGNTEVSLVAKLSQHYEVVHGLMKSGGRWREYDERFRRLMETDEDVVFGSVHFDLYQEARTPVSTGRDGQGRQGQEVCLKFNSLAGCNLVRCKFSHICTSCSRYHPYHQCPSRQPFQPSGSRPAGRPFTQRGSFAPRSEQVFAFGRGQSFRGSRPSSAGSGYGSFSRPPRPQGPRFANPSSG